MKGLYVISGGGGGGANLPLYARNNSIDYYTSFFTYDAAYNKANGVYDFSGDPTGTPYLLADFWNLTTDNPFGNSKRFTSDAGGYWDELANTYHLADGTASNYATVFGTNAYFIDHYTGYGWGTAPYVGTHTFATALTNVNGLTHNGFSDYRMPCFREWITLNSYVGDSRRVAILRTLTVGKPIFTTDPNSCWMSDSYNASFALSFNGTQVMTRGIGSGTIYFYIRNHY